MWNWVVPSGLLESLVSGDNANEWKWEQLIKEMLWCMLSRRDAREGRRIHQDETLHFFYKCLVGYKNVNISSCQVRESLIQQKKG